MTLAEGGCRSRDSNDKAGVGGRGRRLSLARVGDYESNNKEIRRWANGRPQNTGGPFELSEKNPNCGLKNDLTEDRPNKSVEETSPLPPLIMVMGRSWSPSIYGAVRLLGNTVDVAWRMAFIHPLTFI